MERKDTGFKVIAICGLLIAVVGLTIGFAALSATLTITNTTATVKQVDAFSPYVGFTAIGSCEGTAGSITSGDDLTAAGAEVKCVNSAALDTSAASTKGTKDGVTYYGSIKDLSVQLYAQGDSVTQTVTIKNGSLYSGTLTSISADKISCANSTTDPTKGAYTTDELAAICSHISATITVGTASATTTSTTPASYTGTTEKLGASSSIDATIKVEYKSDDTTDDLLLTKGDVTVTVPTISIVYTAD